jgi:hypothetical protein
MYQTVPIRIRAIGQRAGKNAGFPGRRGLLRTHYDTHWSIV